jgi:pyocin large subunit-like protein
MSLFTKILDKLMGDKSASVPNLTASTPLHKTAVPAPAAPSAAPVQPITAVDVVGKLEALAKANPEKLNWKTSIVDLLKLLGLDSSFAARKELAVELGIPAEKLADSAAMNIWLHKTVLQKLADNGGNIPKELL